MLPACRSKIVANAAGSPIDDWITAASANKVTAGLLPEQARAVREPIAPTGQEQNDEPESTLAGRRNDDNDG